MARNKKELTPEQARRRLKWLVPLTVILTVVAFVGLGLHLTGVFDPERDFQKRALDDVTKLTEDSQRGVNTDNSEKAQNPDNVQWVALPESPFAGYFKSNDVGYQKSCVAHTKALIDVVERTYPFMSDTFLYPLAYAEDDTQGAVQGATLTTCPDTLLSGYYFVTDGVHNVVYTIHLNAQGGVQESDVSNLYTASGTSSILESLFRTVDANGNLDVSKYPAGWGTLAYLTPYQAVQQVYSDYRDIPSGVLYVTGDGSSEPTQDLTNLWSAWGTHPRPEVKFLKDSESNKLRGNDPTWFTELTSIR